MNIFKGQRAVPHLARLLQDISHIQDIDVHKVIMRNTKVHQLVEEPHPAVRPFGKVECVSVTTKHTLTMTPSNFVSLTPSIT